jgi:tryptophan halogenase
MIQSVLVLGSGSAGLLAALAIKRMIPQVSVRVVRDKDIGVIGVGESTTPNVPQFLFEYLRINPRQFYALSNATWKIGIHFLWGPRPCFEYGFMQQLDAQWSNLPLPNGFYCDEDFSYGDMCTALMSHKIAFRRAIHGGPDIQRDNAFHLYNPDFVKALEAVGREWGIEFVEGRFEVAQKGPNGIESIQLTDGRRFTADLFIDASGFRSELLGKTMGEPFQTFDKMLYCDRAVVGSWERTDEPIMPYTTAETMDAGWCWRIEHEKYVNRGYVFSSGALTEDQAHAEFMKKNPKAKTWDHVVKFRSGRYQRAWVDNVIGVGNACGFVEPLEATALMVACGNAQTLVSMLQQSLLDPTPSIRDLYNDVFTISWDEIRDFLSIHYRFNTRLDTPFWQKCRAEVDVSNVKPLLDFYAENGPTGLCRHRILNRGKEFGIHSAFGIEGYLVMLVGMKVPYKKHHIPTEREWQIWKAHKAQMADEAKKGLTVEEALRVIRSPKWQWMAEMPQQQQPMLTTQAVEQPMQGAPRPV